MNSKMIPVAVINPDAPAESLEAKQPDINNGAEIYGKEAGCSGGRGGSMHLTDLSAGFIASTAIVGNTIPVGAGIAMAEKLMAAIPEKRGGAAV